MRLFFLVFVLLTVMGCVAVQKSIDNYEACKGDVACMAEMEQVKEASFVITKGAASMFPVPSLGECVALVSSNIVAFIFGVLNGRKKG